MEPTFQLRPYQRAAASAVLARYDRQRISSMLLHLPTGSGKTVIAAEVIRRLSARGDFGKTLFVAHRREILDQTAETIRRQVPSATIQVEQGSRTATRDATVTVASVQSLVRRKERYDPTSFSLIICDECHRALGHTWEEIIGYFHERKQADSLLLGMTATPRRSDGRSISSVFREVAFEVSRTELEDLGYLVPMAYYSVRTELSLDRVQMSAGDFQVRALSAVMDMPAIRALTVAAWLEMGKGKKTIAFCAGVDHAHHLADDFMAQGMTARPIDGRTKDRGEILEVFRGGDIQILTNYGVLTEGFDDRAVQCILMARPTTSPLVYTQCVGRGLRTAPGKPSCTVIDIVDRNIHQLQYGAGEMAGLSRRWRCRGGDPFRQARSLAGIKVTSPEAFLAIRDAESLEEVQSILMRLPAEVVVAGLDDKPVLYYEPCNGSCDARQAERQACTLLRQAGARARRITVDAHAVQIAFPSPEVDNEQFAYLKWHLERVTSRKVSFSATDPRRIRSPRALLRSLLPEGSKLVSVQAGSDDRAMIATIVGLTREDAEEIERELRDTVGVELQVRGQLSLFG
ncbi:MAG: DEAD/DEAH box helicase [Polyangiaceae bacterium]|jgi:superfamily II DNA or RNA helicase|nr:DEAD/DEAH box helicase [Polyangiaceae bacterium]